MARQRKPLNSIYIRRADGPVALSLPTSQFHTAFTNHCVVAVGETIDEFLAVSDATGRDDLSSSGTRMRESDVVGDCPVKEKVVL